MIMFAGDPHGDFQIVKASSAEADVVVLVGDQVPGRDLAEELGGELAQKTWFILGNHDGDCQETLDRHAGMAERDLHGRVRVIDGVSVAGLSGVFRGKVWRPGQDDPLEKALKGTTGITRKNYKASKHQVSIFPEDVVRLAKLRNVDILVTHEAPESHPHGFRLIGDLARIMGVGLVVHGHHHRQYQATLEGGIGVVGLGLHMVWCR
jgi:predicted phosphodiesterase